MVYKICILVALVLPATCMALAGNAALQESFDAVAPPALPAGWTSSRVKAPGLDDIVTASGTAHTPPNALLATNATVAQYVVSPAVSFTDRNPDQIQFFVRRSSSFRAACVLEASTDGGASFPFLIGDTMRASTSTSYVGFTMSLPGSLAGIPAVRFRWRVIPDQSGTTGTLRFDDISITVRPSVDRSLIRLGILPVLPSEDEPATVIFTLRNCGGPVTEPMHIVLRAGDEGPPRVMFDESYPDTIAPGDTISLSAPIAPLRPGECLLTAFLLDSLDQDRSNDTARLACIVGFRPGSVAINEIMYAPAAPEPEWVEIINRRSDDINLRNWLMSDATHSSRHLVTRLPIRLPPSGFGILTRDTAAFSEVHGSFSGPLLPVSGFPSLNNDGDVVIVYDPGGRVIDSVAYEPAWGGAAGRSLERIDTAATSGDRTNWGTSKAPGGSTPGSENSIARRDRDIALDSLALLPADPLVGDTLQVTAWLRNTGRMPLIPGDIVFTYHSDAPMVESRAVMTFASELLPRAHGQTDVATFRARPGPGRIAVSIAPAGDEVSDNDTAAVTFTVEARRGGVCINEIMYDPRSGEPEWIELFNVTADTLTCADWRIGNRAARYRLGEGAGSLLPAGYAVVSRDSLPLLGSYGRIAQIIQISTLPQYLLGKQSDAVVLVNSRGMTMDSVGYQSSWGGLGGVSLERRDVQGASCEPSNWASSVDASGGTPGRANSIERLDQDLRAGRLAARPESHKHGVRLSASVFNDGKRSVGGWGVTFWTGGEPIGRTLAPAPLERDDSVDIDFIWRDPPPGMRTLVAVVDTTGDARTGNNCARCTVAVPFDAGIMVVNEIMFDPGSGKAEYVECLNISSHEVDLNGWTLTDRSRGSSTATVMVVANNECTIGPGGFVTLASDTTVQTAFSGTAWGDRSVLIADRWGKLKLGNSGDALTVRDASGVTIDSVWYNPAWHRSGIGDCTGRSLERIRYSSGSNDPRNWSSSVDVQGGTPGRKNSIDAVGSQTGAALSISPNPFSPDNDGYEDFAVLQYEAPVDVAVISIRIFDVRGRLVRRLANNEASGGTGERIWDGNDDERRRVRIGVYIVLLEACDEGGNARCSARSAIVVAGRL